MSGVHCAEALSRVASCAHADAAGTWRPSTSPSSLRAPSPSPFAFARQNYRRRHTSASIFFI
eukprot:scaffold30462_cov28-Tisochrysis_lutea.AAC.1